MFALFVARVTIYTKINKNLLRHKFGFLCVSVIERESERAYVYVFFIALKNYNNFSSYGVVIEIIVCRLAINVLSLVTHR